MSDYIEVLDETDPGSNLVGDTLIHTDKTHPACRLVGTPDYFSWYPSITGGKVVSAEASTPVLDLDSTGTEILVQLLHITFSFN